MTQQLVRLSRRTQRTYVEKLRVLFRLTTQCSLVKRALNSYASHAPFGGNVVGLSAAAWRYFGQSPQNLSWGEAATLAVLPNARGALFIREKSNKLKQDRLLLKLYKNHYIDSLTYQLSIQELLPQKPHALPQTASHLVSHLSHLSPKKIIF